MDYKTVVEGGRWEEVQGLELKLMWRGRLRLEGQCREVLLVSLINLLLKAFYGDYLSCCTSGSHFGIFR